MTRALLIKPVSVLFFLLASLCLMGVLNAQHRETRLIEQERTRKLERKKEPANEVPQKFELGEADGLKLIIYQKTAGGMVAVSPEKSFRSGDRFKLNLQSNFDGFVYVVNTTPGGENWLLFPRKQSRGNNVRAGNSFSLPAASEFRFNDEAGIEVLQIVMSRSPIPFLETALDRAPASASQVLLNKAAAVALEQLAGKSTRLKSGGISVKAAAAAPKSGWKTRKLTLDRKEQKTIVVVSGQTGKQSRFQPGELSIIEIRLKHIPE
jgi:hypothetical protein